MFTLVGALCLELTIYSVPIENCIKNTQDHHWFNREQAEKELKHLLDQYDDYRIILGLIDKYLQSNDPEIKRRLANAYNHYLYNFDTTSIEIPWIDMLPQDYPNRTEIIGQYLGKSREMISNYEMWCYYSDYHDYRLATSLLIQDMLKSGIKKKQIKELLERMNYNEFNYILERTYVSLGYYTINITEENGRVEERATNAVVPRKTLVPLLGLGKLP